MPRRHDAALLAVMAALLPGGAGAAGQFGVDWREQAEYVSADGFGIATQADDAVWLHRLLARAALRHEPSGAQVFLQLGAAAQNGRNGGSSPVDESAPDLQQGFVDLPLPGPQLRLRAGRQEWSLGSGRLVSVRDGPNLRRAFDALQLDAAQGDTRLRMFFGRPVANADGAFDDAADASESLGGLYAQLPLPPDFAADVYWLDYRRDEALYAGTAAGERRASYGLRLHGGRGGWAFDTELVWQSGRHGDRRLRAWTVASDTRYRLVQAAGAPRLGFKLDIASGDADAQDGRLQTFNALYPNPSYFSDAALIAPANLVDLQPYLQLNPAPALTLHLGWNLIWKHRREDAIYTTPVPLTPVPGSSGGARFVGHQLQASLRWAANRRLQLEGSYVHFTAGDGLRDAGGEDVDFLQLVASVSY